MSHAKDFELDPIAVALMRLGGRPGWRWVPAERLAGKLKRVDIYAGQDGVELGDALVDGDLAVAGEDENEGSYQLTLLGLEHARSSASPRRRTMGGLNY